MKDVKSKEVLEDIISIIKIAIKFLAILKSLIFIKLKLNFL